MKKILFIACIVLYGCAETPKQEPKPEPTFGIVIHGGAGTILRKNMTPEKEQEYRAVLAEAIQVGHRILKAGGSSQEAVEKTIHVMEESPLFNAGKGAVLNAEGSIELDASFMRGDNLDAGAISGVKTIKHPISAAIQVMEASPHVMLSGGGADTFAAAQGLEIVAPEYFFTERRINALKRVQEAAAAKETSWTPEERNFLEHQRYGTVGCVALDKYGNIAAGTSTGGMTNKRWGRIGDAPIIGSGTYANNLTCGVSSTGWGEYFIRSQVAYDISAQMEYQQKTLKEATTDVIQNKLTKLGGTGGVVALDKNGNMSFEFNTAGMYRSSMNDKGELVVKIYKE